MRLWHKDLIPYLPKQQLIGQWRECCLIAKNIAERGTPNHLLVNKIMNYPKWHFRRYTELVIKECENRGYKIAGYKFYVWFNRWIEESSIKYFGGSDSFIFNDWHTGRYLKQCLYNLEEKYDCGGIPEDEWSKILTHFIW